MTTIAYDHKNGLICADGRVTSGGLIETENSIKHYKREGVNYFISGKVGDIEKFLDLTHKVKGCTKIEADLYPDCMAFVVKDGSKEVFVSDIHPETGEHILYPVTYNHAIGSGWQHAKSYMSLIEDYDVEDAVRYASTKDAFTGKPYLLFSLQDWAYITL